MISFFNPDYNENPFLKKKIEMESGKMVDR